MKYHVSVATDCTMEAIVEVEADDPGRAEEIAIEQVRTLAIKPTWEPCDPKFLKPYAPDPGNSAWPAENPTDAA